MLTKHTLAVGWSSSQAFYTSTSSSKFKNTWPQLNGTKLLEFLQSTEPLYMVHKTAFKVISFFSPNLTNFGDYSQAMQGLFLLCRVTFRELCPSTYAQTPPQRVWITAPFYLAWMLFPQMQSFFLVSLHHPSGWGGGTGQGGRRQASTCVVFSYLKG